jgi:dCMP deaminase
MEIVALKISGKGRLGMNRKILYSDPFPATNLRPDWDEYFLLIAKLVSTRSTCNSRPTGAVLVKDRQILATGYNGSMPGADHCSDHGPDYCHRREMDVPDSAKYNFCRASHAEANAIAQAAKHGIPVAGASLYVTLEPCYVCLKLLATARIEKVFFELPYQSTDHGRDDYWRREARAVFSSYKQINLDPETISGVIPYLTAPTSERRLISL